MDPPSVSPVSVLKASPASMLIRTSSTARTHKNCGPLDPDTSIAARAASLDNSSAYDSAARLLVAPMMMIHSSSVAADAGVTIVTSAVTSSRKNQHETALTRRATKKHVRGLWKEQHSATTTAVLHDALLLLIFKIYLPMADLLRCQGVSQRWRSLASTRSLWTHVDVTGFVEQAYFASNSSRQATSLALAEKLQAISPVQLTIGSSHLLSADSFSLPFATARKLQVLELKGFTELTDTHVHALLLCASNSISTSRSKRLPLVLQTLKLIDCPNLTNSCLRSIAMYCPKLQELSLAGCNKIDNVAVLQEALTLDKRSPPVPFAKIPRPVIRPSLKSPPSSLQSLFAPPLLARAQRTCLTQHKEPSQASTSPTSISELISERSFFKSPPPPMRLQASFAPPASPLVVPHKIDLESLFASATCD